MSDLSLNAREKKQGRKYFLVFLVINTFSFQLISGNIITLYALRLGASSAFIGIVSSFIYVSFFFLLIGRKLVERFGLIRLFASAWITRFIFLSPILFTPLLFDTGNSKLGYVVFIISVLGFNAFRGIGISAQSPIIGSLSEGKDRGSFLARFQIFTHLMLISAGLMIALLLGNDAPLNRYSLFILMGIVLGASASFLLLKVPEPPAFRNTMPEKLFSTVKKAFKKESFRKFIIAFAIVSFVAGTVRPFIIVYSKQVYGQSDQTIMFFVVIGSVGAVLMGLIARQVLDRIGAKPLYVIFSCMLGISLVVPLISPDLNEIHLFILLAGMFFFFTLGLAGEENTAQNYFFALVSPEEQLNLGVLYWLIFGLAGSLGSLLGGVFVDALLLSGVFSTIMVWRIFFSILLVLLVYAIFRILGLERLGAYSVKSALGVLFSLRDLRAITLLNRLDRTTNVVEEQKVLKAIGSLSSEISSEDVIKKLDSPSLTIRSEALYALEKLPPDERIANILVEHVDHYQFTTAHIAARIIGQLGLKKGIPILRKELYSEDYLLASQCMISLSRLGDRSSITQIETIIKSTINPRLLTYAAAAFGIFNYEKGIPLLLSLLRRESCPPFLREEVIFTLAGLVDMGEWFYSIYKVFREKPSDGISLLIERLEKQNPSKKRPFADKVKEILNASEEDEAELSRNLSGILSSVPRPVRSTACELILKEALRDTELIRFDRFRYFLCAYLVKLVELYPASS